MQLSTKPQVITRQDSFIAIISTICSCCSLYCRACSWRINLRNCSQCWRSFNYKAPCQDSWGANDLHHENGNRSSSATWKGRAFSTVTCLNLRPPYPAMIVMKPYPVGHTVPKFENFGVYKGNTREHLAPFIDSMGPFSHDTVLCLREFKM